jgi:hypothetical protein
VFRRRRKPHTNPVFTNTRHRVPTPTRDAYIAALTKIDPLREAKCSVPFPMQQVLRLRVIWAAYYPKSVANGDGARDFCAKRV